MKKFLSLLLLCGLFTLSPCVQAQKWQGIKKALSAKQIKTTAFALRGKVESVIFRAARLGQAELLVKPQNTGRKLLQVSSLAAFAPARVDLPSLKVVPPFPFESNSKEMYRGMALKADGKDLRYIMLNGMEVSKSHYENFAAYDNNPYPDGTKAIYAAHNPKHALHFIFTEEDWDTYIPVIFHIKKLGWRDFASIPHDVPPSWIYRVSALLKINGQFVWGELKLYKGDFVFMPYPVKSPTGK